MKNLMKFIPFLSILLFSCERNNTNTEKKEWIRGTDKMECLKDSILSNKDTYSYLINKKLNSVDIEVSLDEINFIDTAGYYIDSLDCKAVPKFAYSTQGSMFFISGVAMNYRVLNRYFIGEKKINKQVSYIDDLRKERRGQIYPFLSLDSLKALSIDKDWNFEILSIGILKDNDFSKIDSYVIWDDSIKVEFLDERVESIPLNLE